MQFISGIGAPDFKGCLVSACLAHPRHQGGQGGREGGQDRAEAPPNKQAQYQDRSSQRF